jgi:hypothetical protein
MRPSSKKSLQNHTTARTLPPRWISRKIKNGTGWCLPNPTRIPLQLTSRHSRYRSRDDSLLIIETRLKIFEDFRLCHDFLDDLIDKKSTYFGERLDVLTNHPVRVAIIDNGVDKVRTTLFGRIDNGISFVKTLSGDRILPWWMVADPHGTQMASLVQAVNPFCRLYIARVGKRRDDIDSEKAAEVNSRTEDPFSSFFLC